VSRLVEQAGAMTGNRAAGDIGTAISLISPTDALWRLAAFHLQPAIPRDLQFGAAFIVTGTLPTAAMIWWAVAFMLAIRLFDRRAL